MNKNISGAIMLSLVAFVANDSQATNLNNIEHNSKFSNFFQNDLKIFKYSKIGDNDLLNIWISNDYKRKILDNPKLLSSFQNESVKIQIHEFEKDNTLSFVIPYFEADNLSIDEIENLLAQEIIQTTTKQLPIDILARALKDIKFKEKLIKEPKTIFVDMGDMDEESNYDIKIYQDTKEVKNIILPNSPINNDQLDMYKSKVAYFNSCTMCHDDVINGNGNYAPYDTTIRIECTSIPTCM